MPPCRAGAALPGRFAETLDSCPPTGQLEIVFQGCREQGAQVGHGGVALALAREFEVYDMVVHSGGAIDLRI